ncbi:MAG: DUF3303 family protein [Candidatus Bathyarchaeia archaeon]
MKFIAFWEGETDIFEDFVEIWRKRVSENRQVQTLLPPHTIAEASSGFKGFTVFEAEDADEIMEYVTDYGSIADVKILPIWESSKGTEMYKEKKK